ncbi:hypothetical protein E2C01_016795 [Portunus trituberculatus]|uniref:Uncharacterized protein n=1 Tax=Portunus trituberculatus TaxID=210409 RepID=A0A5B7DRR6_PORTR|nr:hypothetical protein [Portunus trituberculatus]
MKVKGIHIKFHTSFSVLIRVPAMTRLFLISLAATFPPCQPAKTSPLPVPTPLYSPTFTHFHPTHCCLPPPDTPTLTHPPSFLYLPLTHAGS